MGIFFEQLRAENNELRAELKRNEAKISERDTTITYLQRTLDEVLSAKEKGCLRGPYCRYCAHSVVDKSLPGCERCICTYGTCEHFEKAVS